MKGEQRKKREETRNSFIIKILGEMKCLAHSADKEREREGEGSHYILYWQFFDY